MAAVPTSYAVTYSLWNIFIPIAKERGLNTEAMDQVWKLFTAYKLPSKPGELVDLINLAIDEWLTQ